jgi:nitroreductase
MFAELVRNARSCRRFIQSDPIPLEALRQLVNVARVTPSGGNEQPLRYAIAHGPEICAKVFPALRWAARLKDWGGPKEGERPTGYIFILSSTEKGSPATEVGIASQTIQLGATDLGYAACQFGSVDRALAAAAIDLPAQWRINLVIALGRQGEKIVLEDVAAGEPIYYYRSKDNVHHVPKIRLEDVLVRQATRV